MPKLRLLKPTRSRRRARSADDTRVLPRSEVDLSCKYPL
jgi:hypothetical protein